MKRTLLVILAISSCFVIMGGCSGGETSTTKADEEAFRKPPTAPPADLSQKMEQAAAAGRDSHQTETR